MTFDRSSAGMDKPPETKGPRPRHRDVNRDHRQSLSGLERLAVRVTRAVGTMTFFLLIAGWSLGWLVWNLVAPPDLRFDPAPAFVLWLFVSNLIQIHLMPLIMVGQGLQGRHAELRAQADFEVDQKVGSDVLAILARLDRQNEILLDIVRRIEQIGDARRGAPGPHAS